jgi:DNA-binding response OmpR family regulator
MERVLKRQPLHVAIVSRNPETVEGLARYLEEAGAITSSTSALVRAPAVGAPTSALVIFPDDYPWDAVLSTLARCRAETQTLPLVIVTRSPRQFEAFALADEGALTVVIPKPAWSWTILDAIRLHLHETSAKD